MTRSSGWTRRAGILLRVLITMWISGADPGAGAAGGRDGEAAEAQAPELRVVGWEIDDTISGNGDLALQPGETAEIRVHLYNAGNQIAHGVFGQLSEVADHPDVEVTGKLATWPDVPASGTLTPSTTHFEVQVASTRPCSWEIPLDVVLYADGGYVFQQRLTLSLEPLREIDLATDAASPILYGADPLDELGNRTAIGDLDGDGIDDLILGMWRADGLTDLDPNTGEVAVRYGDPAGWGDVDMASPPAAIAVIYPPTLSDDFGTSVATADIDGNGLDEIVVGFDASDGPGETRPGSGAVVMLSSATALSGTIDLTAPPPGLSVGIFHGVNSNDSLGRAAVGADVNGDGFEDIIASAPRGDGATNAGIQNGEVFVIYGRLNGLPGEYDLASPGIPVTTIWGDDDYDSLGMQTAAGDLDGDGYDDLVLMASGWGPDNLRVYAGEAVIVYGGPGTLADIDLAATTLPPNVVRIYGREYDYMDNAAVGDLDGDGFDDLILGAPANIGVVGNGGAYVLYGGPERFTEIDLAFSPPGVGYLLGISTGATTGSSLATGDVDGDGYDDLLVASRGASPLGRASAGVVTLIPGGPERIGTLSLAFPPATAARFLGTSADQVLEVGPPGDFNGDGLTDILLRNQRENGPAIEAGLRTSAGEVQVVPGEPGHRYRDAAATYSFIDATPGSDLGLACDDCSTTIPLGFEFDFFGRKYSDVTVSSNGYLTFGGPGDVLPIFCPGTSSQPNNLIAAYWDDFDLSAGGSVHALLEGAAPFRRLTVEWLAVPDYEGTGDVTFEATLFESSDQILFQYLDATLAGSPGQGQIVGVENATGRVGTEVSCFAPGQVSDGAAVRLRRYDNPFVVFTEDAESSSGWIPTGLWHKTVFPDCYPDYRSPGTAWYYGQSPACDYQTGAVNAGDLTSPVIPALPQDAALKYWYRRQTEGETTYDVSTVTVSADGGAFVQVDQNLDDAGLWRRREDTRSSAVDLSGLAGQDLQIRFRFDTVDGSLNGYLGWMVDDIAIEACPVTGGAPLESGAAAEARATARLDAICELDSGLVDAVGSYCNSCPVPLTFQWSEQGVILPGAIGPDYVIPSAHATGTFDYTVAIACPTNPGCAATSPAASISVVPVPEVVGATLQVEPTGGGTELLFTWADTAGSQDYVLYRSAGPSGIFTEVAGSAPSGATGLVLPVSAGDLVFYRVAGRNEVCGAGAQE